MEGLIRSDHIQIYQKHNSGSHYNSNTYGSDLCLFCEV